MTLRIHRQFIATIAALAIAITGFSAAPARAGDEDLAKALAVILGVAIVGSAINNRNDRKERQQVHVPQPQVHPRHVQPQYGHVQPQYGHAQPRQLPRHVDRRLLPQQCLFNLRTDSGHNAQVFGQRCLHHNYQYSNGLPQDCGQRVWTSRGAQYGYNARCLSQYGYQLARR